MKQFLSMLMAVVGILVVCWRDPFIGVGLALYVVGFMLFDLYS